MREHLAREGQHEDERHAAPEAPERKPTPGMLRALVSVLGGGEEDEVAAMRAIGWTTKDARAFVRGLPKAVTNV